MARCPFWCTSSAVDLRSSRAALTVCLLALSHAARAQNHGHHHHRDESDSAAIRDAQELRRHHRNEEALQSLQRIYQETLDTEALVEIAHTEAQLARWADAEGHYVEALGATQDPWLQRNQSAVETALAAARDHLTTLTVEGTPLGAAVRINRRQVGRLPLPGPLRIDAGTTLLEVEAPGYLPFVRSLELPGNGTHAEHAVLRREFETAAPVLTGPTPTSATACQADMVLRNGLCYPRNPPPSGLMDPRVTRGMLWGGVAVAAVSVGLAVGLWLDGNATERDYLADCGGNNVPTSCNARWASDQSALSGRGTLVDVLWIGAAVGAGVAITGAVLGVRASTTERVALRGSTLSVVW